MFRTIPSSRFKNLASVAVIGGTTGLFITSRAASIWINVVTAGTVVWSPPFTKATSICHYKNNMVMHSTDRQEDSSDRTCNTTYRAYTPEDDLPLGSSRLSFKFWFGI
jgi:hypothetical protein